MSKASQPLLVTFEDGTEVTVEPRPKDLARAEIAGYDFQESGPIGALYAAAHATLGRMGRAGGLPEGLEVPESLQDFIDAADVEPQREDDAEGEDSGQGPTSGESQS